MQTHTSMLSIDPCRIKIIKISKMKVIGARLKGGGEGGEGDSLITREVQTN